MFGVGDVTLHQDDDNDDWGEGEESDVGGRAGGRQDPNDLR